MGHGGLDAAGRSCIARDAALDVGADNPRQVHRRPHRRAPRRARCGRGLAAARRRRCLPRAGDAAPVREATADPRRSRCGAHEGGRRGVPGLGRRARSGRLPEVPPRARAHARADVAQGGVLRAVRRSVRRPARRLRAGHAHRGRGEGLRHAPARAHRAGGRACRGRGGRAPARALRDRQAGRALARDHHGVRGGLGQVPPRPDSASVRGHLRRRRHPPHHEVRRARPELPVHRDARGRARPVRVGREPVARPHADGRRSLLSAARVPEPPVGERRRALAPVLALVLPAAAGGVPGEVRIGPGPAPSTRP